MVSKHQQVEMRLGGHLIAVGDCINEFDIEVIEIDDGMNAKKHKQIEIKLMDHHIATIKCINELDIEIPSAIDYSNWTELKPFLEDGTIGKNWWDYSELDRRTIAETAIKNTLFYYIQYGRSGESDCMGGVGDFRKTVCLQNAMIRYLKFGSDYPSGGDVCYYKNPQNDDECCYAPNAKYHLPCCKADCVTYGGGYGHSMCAIQVNENITNIDSWIFFQYSDFDIKPGDPQMPTHLYPENVFVRVSTIKRLLSCNSCEPNEVMRWEF